MTKQREISDCAKEYYEIRNSLREMAQGDSVQARAQADKLIQDLDPTGDIMAELVSFDNADTLSEKFRKLQEAMSPENAAAVAFTARSRKATEKGR